MRDVLDCFRTEEPEPPQGGLWRMVFWLLAVCLLMLILTLTCR